MKIIVTGGAGFIGSHIVDAYIAKGHSVAVIDDLSTGSRANVHSRARFYKADINDYAAIEKVFKKERPDVVNHHAAQIRVVASTKDPLGTLMTNVMGTASVLLGFTTHKRSAGKFIFASTGGALYGNPKKLPASEKIPPQPESPYGLSKILSENLIRFYAHMHKFPYTVLRYANAYGPRQNPKGEAGVVAIFTGLMQRGTRPTIFGDGTKGRDYVYVGDIARANVLALRKGNNETINIGTGAVTSDKELFGALAKEIGFTGLPRYAPWRPGEIYRISLDARRAGRILGWKPATTLPQGIRHAVRYYETA